MKPSGGGGRSAGRARFFVGDVPVGATDAQLHALLSKFGTVVTLEDPGRTKRTVRPDRLGFRFVVFSAQKAGQLMLAAPREDLEINGRFLFVAKEPPRKGEYEIYDGCTVRVRGFRASSTDRELAGLMKTFGEISYYRRHEAFLHCRFVNAEDAEKACAGMTFEGRQLNVRMASKKGSEDGSSGDGGGGTRAAKAAAAQAAEPPRAAAVAAAKPKALNAIVVNGVEEWMSNEMLVEALEQRGPLAHFARSNGRVFIDYEDRDDGLAALADRTVDGPGGVQLRLALTGTATHRHQPPPHRPPSVVAQLGAMVNGDERVEDTIPVLSPQASLLSAAMGGGIRSEFEACANCGFQNLPGLRFCNNCGSATAQQ